MENITTIDSIRLDQLSEYFNYIKNLGYKVLIGVSTVDDIYLRIEFSDDKPKVFKFNSSEQIFEYSRAYTHYVFNRIYHFDKSDSFNFFLKDFIEELNSSSINQRNQMLRKSVDDLMFLKNTIYAGFISETLIDEYNKSHYKASSDYIIQHFFINNKRTHIYFDFKTNVYQFDKDITNEYSLTDLKNAFLKYANEKIIDYEVNIDYNNDIIKHRNNTIQKLKQIYSEFFI